MIKPCKCGSRDFKIEAQYDATDFITLADDESEDFTITDTHFGSGEWDSHATVTCISCSKEMLKFEWENQDDEEEVATDGK